VIEHTLTQYSYTNILRAIKNYFKMLVSDQYIYNYKFRALSDFLGHERGLKQFIDPNIMNKYKKYSQKEKTMLETLKGQFKPVTRTYNPLSLLDTKERTYYGFELDSITDNNYIAGLMRDITYKLNHKEKITYGVFEWIELCIASLFFNRKHIDEQKLMTQLTELISVWDAYKNIFCEVAKKLREEMY
jgi:hypothetical protein